MSHHELLRALRLDAAKEGSKARQEFELAARELAAKHERRLKMSRDDLELRRKHELHEVRGRGGDAAPAPASASCCICTLVLCTALCGPMV